MMRKTQTQKTNKQTNKQKVRPLLTKVNGKPRVLRLKGLARGVHQTEFNIFWEKGDGGVGLGFQVHHDDPGVARGNRLLDDHHLDRKVLSPLNEQPSPIQNLVVPQVSNLNSKLEGVLELRGQPGTLHMEPDLIIGHSRGLSRDGLHQGVVAGQDKGRAPSTEVRQLPKRHPPDANTNYLDILQGGQNQSQNQNQEEGGGGLPPFEDQWRLGRPRCHHPGVRL